MSDRDWEIWNEETIKGLEKKWLVEKDYWYKLIKPHLKYVSDVDTIIDVGCGIGMYYDLLSSITENYLGLDVTKKMVERARQRKTNGIFRVGDIFNLGDNNAELIFSWSVLCHLPHKKYKEAIEELWRVSGKYTFFNVYVADEDFSFRGSSNEIISGITMKRLMSILENLDGIHLIKMNEYEKESDQEGIKFQRQIFTLKRA